MNKTEKYLIGFLEIFDDAMECDGWDIKEYIEEVKQYCIDNRIGQYENDQATTVGKDSDE